MNYTFAGCDTVQLAQKYKTPLYLMSEDMIVDKIDEIKASFLNKYDHTLAYYASKAFLTLEMARIIKREGLGLDVVSGGELYTAKRADFPMKMVMFHGNNKSPEEINMGLDYGVGHFVCDSLSEILLIEELAEKQNKKAPILIRVTPAVEADTHKYISTGNEDSKFGLPLKNLEEIVKLCTGLGHINLKGFHFHVGSQLMDNSSHVAASKILLKIIKNLKEKLNFITEELNIGGGFGIYYTKGDEPKRLSHFVDPVMEMIESFCQANQIKRPKILIEPGRWIVGEAGITLYTVGSIKEIPGIRTYVGIDGGLPDNPRPALYEAVYEAVVANKAEKELTDTVTIAGKCCESGDILIWDLKTPQLERGDILAVKATGAYNYSMASNYNKIPKPPVVMIKDGVDRLIVKRESFEDLLRNEI